MHNIKSRNISNKKFPKFLNQTKNTILFRASTNIEDPNNRFANIRSYITINRRSGSVRRDVTQAYSNKMVLLVIKLLYDLYSNYCLIATDQPFASRATGVEQHNMGSPPLPPINQIVKSKSFVSMSIEILNCPLL